MLEAQMLEQMLGQEPPSNIETLPLRELLLDWGNMLWLVGMRPMLQSLLELDLTMSENFILRQLQQKSLTIAEVATELSITHSAASRVVDRLVCDGFVSRVENPADRRQKVLTLTPAGADMLHDIQGKFTAGIESLVARLSLEEQEEFRRLIARLIAANYAEQAGGHVQLPQTGKGSPLRSQGPCAN